MLGSVLGVPGTGRTGAGRRGLSMEVAEAALKFPDAFEALVKILEIGGFWTLPAGRARYGALFVGITAGQAGMWSRGMGAVPWPCRPTASPLLPRCRCRERGRSCRGSTPRTARPFLTMCPCPEPSSP